MVLNVFDTAGIHETEDKIESLGIDKSKEYINKATLVLFVVDASSPLSCEDKAIFASIKDKNVIILLNKTDLGVTSFENIFENTDQCTISALTGDGLDALSAMIEEKFRLGEIAAENRAIITNIRHKEALTNANASILRAIDALKSDVPYDLLSIDVLDCAAHLGEITGKTVSEEVVDKIFARFCLGK